MRNYTDSSTVEYHDDGSKTVTTVETLHPVSKKQQALATGVLGLVVMAPVIPLIVVAAYDRVEEKRAARKAKKAALKSV